MRQTPQGIDGCPSALEPSRKLGIAGGGFEGGSGATPSAASRVLHGVGWLSHLGVRQGPPRPSRAAPARRAGPAFSTGSRACARQRFPGMDPAPLPIRPDAGHGLPGRPNPPRNPATHGKNRLPSLVGQLGAVQLAGAQRPAGHRPVHDLPEALVVARLDEVDHLVDHNVFKARRRLLGPVRS